jgi:DNA polymerase-3 subunit gamma/tau
MDYLVLARKLRPVRFAELIGQEPVARILRNAIRQDRVAHAFLFAGARGVGKTSAARILTKLWNCLAPQDAEPCNACANCEEITRNASPDVYEIDAASNRGIDHIRELRENIKFAPAKCRYKTYIIDEVHMLTIESFNALLKTLEEPPPHVKFILATTNPHKIPETILSRCQRFDFSRIPVAMMTDYLTEVTRREGIPLSRHALEAIARNAAGSVRDALTGLDQVVAYCGNTVADEQVHQVLGLMDRRAVLTLLGALLDHDLRAALAAFGAIVAHGHDLQVLLEAMLREIKDLSLFAALGEKDPYFQDHAPEVLSFFRERGARLNPDVAQQLFYLFLELEAQLKRSQFAQACFEMALVKACQIQSLVGVPELLAQARVLLEGAPPAPSAPAAPPLRARPATASNPFGRLDRPGASAAEAIAPPGSEPARRPFAAAREKLAAIAGESADPARAADEPHENSSGAATPEPASPPGASAPAAQPFEGDSAVEDPRWEAFIGRVYALGKRKLAAHLRQSEVVRGEEDALEVIPPDHAARDALLAEQEWLAPPFAEAFGASSRIVINRDTSRLATAGQSLRERRDAQARARREELRQEALEDEVVRRVRRFFPDGRVESVILPEPSSE